MEVILVIFLLIGIWIYLRKRKSRYLTPLFTYPSSTTSIKDKRELKAQIQELIKYGWTQEETRWASKFLLNSRELKNYIVPAEVVEKLLNHVRETAPQFSVPYMIPRTVVEATPFAAGLFEVDKDGWVTIKVSPNFFEDKLAAQAILAHEVCHYILENSGIRYRDVLINERYTDLCMFVCGFGEIFLAGYKRKPAQNEYSSGHRLGYLTDAEYQFAHRYVKRIRKSYKENLHRELDTKKSQLLQLLRNDESAMTRLIEYERRRNPNQSEVALYEIAIYSLQRGR